MVPCAVIYPYYLFPSVNTMPDKTFSVLILDPAFSNKSVIRDTLADNGFKVHVETNEGGASAALENFKPDIILCRASSQMITDNNLLCDFRKRVDERGIPFVVVPTTTDINYFLQWLGQGIYHSIMPPFETEYLTSRIRDILKHNHVIIRDGPPVSINFNYRDLPYSMNITPAKLVQFIISILHNSMNLSLTLSEAMQKRNMLAQRIFKPEIFGGVRHQSEAELQMEQELYRALDHNEFQLYYQPIIALDEERMTGFEALIRWNHPERGLVPPFEFIPLAERLPLIIPLGFWIIEEAVRQLISWEKKFIFNEPIRIGINISGNQFIHPELSDGIAVIIKEHRVNPENIVFEITESAFMADIEAANFQLLRLKSNKHPISMDDFGTGYSSLTYLQHFIVDTVKIDKSFVRWMHMDEQSEQIVRSVIGLAHNLRMKGVAEGGEEVQHRNMLRELDCDYGQGYYFSVPLDAFAAEEYMLNFYKRR